MGTMKLFIIKGCVEMNREHTRDHMIFQLLVNTHFTEQQLNTMSDKQIRLYYDYFVERLEEVR